MNIKIGDKVRFLNDVGGGIVRSFKGNDQVIVEDQDGFDIPVLTRECVVIESTATQGKKKNTEEFHSTPKSVDKGKNTFHELEPVIEETPDGDILNVFMAYLPSDSDPKAFASTTFECYFINDSNYFLFFNYMIRSNSSWISHHHGVIEPNTQIFLEEFGKEELNDRETICVQVLAYKENKPYRLKNSYSVELHVDPVKFYKLHSFASNDYFEDDALIVPIIRNDLAKQEKLISSIEIEQSMKQKVRISKNAQKNQKTKENTSAILEVDLHASELLETTAGLSSGDILQFQLDHFHEILRENVKNKGKKVVFIHGKGNGVLRNAIEKELKTKYKRYLYQDASFKEYGFGATLVTIK